MLTPLTDPTAAPDPADDVALRRIVALFADAAAGEALLVDGGYTVPGQRAA